MNDYPLSPRQRQVLAWIAAQDGLSTRSSLWEEVGVSERTLNALERKGFIKFTEARTYRALRTEAPQP